MKNRNQFINISTILPANRTPEQQQWLDDYEAENTPPEEVLKKRSEYNERIKKEAHNPLMELDATQFFNSYQYYFEKNEGKPLSTSKNAIADYASLIYYFSKDDRFFNCANLSKITKPSFDKGLLIMGSYGNGKTAAFRAAQQALHAFQGNNFKKFASNEVVLMYEDCANSVQKSEFWNKMISGEKCFDDVKSESEANNYGKVNLFKDIIERRYDRGLKTHMSCNYDPDHPKDVKNSLLEFGSKYGSRAYDRMFEMFNIVEFKGGSFRK